MRNKNIFIRKETQFSCERGSGLPVFAQVRNYSEGEVYYVVDFPEPIRGGSWRWHYADQDQLSGTYVKPLEEFLQRFAPDYDDEFNSFLA